MAVSRRGLLATAGAAAFSGLPVRAAAPQVLRIGMTAADLPTTHGIPNNGGEGFLGYPAYDSVVNWDFSRDKLPDITPGLFTAWRIDEGNPLRWICDVRQGGVKSHDGTDFTADAVIFNFGRIFDEKSPQ
jgi:peptide/nickel transport system substrate-binding protein